MTHLDLQLDSSVGCIVIGILFSLMLYGCTCGQTLFYTWNYREDRLELKAMVGLIWMLDTTRAGAQAQELWYYFIWAHGNPRALETLDRAFEVEQAVAAVGKFIGQVFFIHKIWSLISGRPWFRAPLTLVALLIALISLASGIGMTYEGAASHTFSRIFSKEKIPAALQNTSALTTDVYITLSLCLILRGKRTGFRRADAIVQQFVMYAVNRGALLIMMSLLQLITYNAVDIQRGTLVSEVFSAPGSTVYSNSVLAVLNMRAYVQDAIGVPAGASSQPSEGVLTSVWYCAPPLEARNADGSFSTSIQTNPASPTPITPDPNYIHPLTQ